MVILHGLFGSSKNWVSTARHLSAWGRVFALDLRNHGRSPHADSHSLEDLVGDLERWVQENLDSPPVLLGHSMGGLAAMGYALHRPESLRGLIVVDIAARNYRRGYEAEFQALRLDLSPFATRGEIDRALAPLLPDERKRRFFQTSIEKGPAGFRWLVNGPALESSTLLGGPAPAVAGSYPGPVLLVAGGASPYVRAEDVQPMRARFPNLRLLTIPGADHWVHISAPLAFREAVGGFLRELSGS